MKTLSITPFNLKTTMKNCVRSKKNIKHVDINAGVPKYLGNNLLAIQGSLDYMATNYGLNFKFNSDPEDVWVIISKNDSHDWAYIDEDDEIDMAKHIYSCASKVLKSEDKIKEQESEVIKIMSTSDRLKSSIKNYKGLLEFYNKFYQGMFFEICEQNDGMVIEGIWGLRNANCSIKYNEIEQGYLKIHQMIKDMMKVREPRIATVPKLHQ